MKKLIASIVFTLIGVISAQIPKDGKEPTELNNLRENWQQARKRATDPIDKKYFTALEDLKVRYTKAGNLEAALAVESALKLLKLDGVSSGTGPVEVLPDSKVALGEFLLNTDWKLRDAKGKASGTLRFRDKGVVDMPWHPCTWRPDGSRLVIMNNASDWSFRIEFSDDMKKVMVKHNSGKIEWEGEFSKKVDAK